MRFSVSLALALLATAACGKTGTTMPPGDDMMQPDAPGMTGTPPAFEIVSKDAMLQPGDQITYCYYFHTPNTAEVRINKWVADMSPGSHHAILYLLPGGGGQPDGTLDSSGNCGGQNAAWTFATQTEHFELDLPGDDGTGKPLAQQIPPNTAAVFQLHYLNASDNVLMAHIDLKAYGLEDGAAYTATDAYVTYQYQISVDPGATGVTVPGSCPTPPGAKFWQVSTHAHKQAKETKVMDGTNMLFDSTDWEHPGQQLWMTPDQFRTFSANRLSWSCKYDNNAPPPYCNMGGPKDSCSNANTTVMQGLSAVTDEMCMATSYYFPAQGPKFMVAFGPNNCMGF